MRIISGSEHKQLSGGQNSATNGGQHVLTKYNRNQEITWEGIGFCVINQLTIHSCRKTLTKNYTCTQALLVMYM